MNLQEKLAGYILENISIRHFSDVAILLLNRGYDTESLWILAGLSSKDSSHDYLKYFELSLKELEITLPDKFEAAKILLNYYLEQMVAFPEIAYKLMCIIDNEIYRRVDWVEELRIVEKKYVGEELGLERMFTWYRELQDYEENGMLTYFNEFPREKQKEKFEQKLVEEAKVLKSKIDKEISTNNKK